MVDPSSVVKQILTFNGFKKESFKDKMKWIFILFPFFGFWFLINLIEYSFWSLIDKLKRKKSK